MDKLTSNLDQKLYITTNSSIEIYNIVNKFKDMSINKYYCDIHDNNIEICRMYSCPGIYIKLK